MRANRDAGAWCPAARRKTKNLRLVNGLASFDTAVDCAAADNRLKRRYLESGIRLYRCCTGAKLGFKRPRKPRFERDLGSKALLKAFQRGRREVFEASRSRDTSNWANSGLRRNPLPMPDLDHLVDAKRRAIRAGKMHCHRAAIAKGNRESDERDIRDKI